MKLLLLCLGLSLVCAQLEGKHAVVNKNFDLSKILGEWYSILLASDRREQIEENGDMRVFVKDTHVLANSSLIYKFHKIINGECTEIFLTSDETEEEGVYNFIYNGNNTFHIIETDYVTYIIYVLNINSGTEYKVMELYGRVLSCWHSPWGEESGEEGTLETKLQLEPLASTIHSPSHLDPAPLTCLTDSGGCGGRCRPCPPPSPGADQVPQPRPAKLKHVISVPQKLKHKFVKLCQKHGIVKENVIDLTKVGKFNYLSLSFPTSHLIEGKNLRDSNASVHSPLF
ncbi:major urinary protein 4-like [Choloepus didactylus]|uniref:major urinary protein 4-like n=1 Tax=Choloepus didactylus TaxID=27675 RepID=UPI0018A04766|nr:major urinary protein 4-like [Choloepus didactylus]